MPYRTTAELVGGIIEVETDDDVLPFIFTANEFVTELCTTSGYSTDRLELIERWLSAHLYAVMRSRTKTDQIRTLREEFQSRVDLGFDVTHYGQQAMRIDTAGNLAVLNNSVKKAQDNLPAQRQPARLRWLGRSRREN